MTNRKDVSCGRLHSTGRSDGSPESKDRDNVHAAHESIMDLSEQLHSQ